MKIVKQKPLGGTLLSKNYDLCLHSDKSLQGRQTSTFVIYWLFLKVGLSAGQLGKLCKSVADLLTLQNNQYLDNFNE